MSVLNPARQNGRNWHGATPEALVKESLAKVRARLESQDLAKELKFMADIREAVPAGMQTFWDMTIAAYWGWSCWDAREGQFHSAQGAGGLGYGFPAAIGGAVGLETVGRPGRVLAVSGDGSAMYSISELATAKQHNIPVTWLIVDDGGYGILREYMVGAFGKATATELARPDFVKLAEAFGYRQRAWPLRAWGTRSRRASRRTGRTSSSSKRSLKCSLPPIWTADRSRNQNSAPP